MIQLPSARGRRRREAGPDPAHDGASPGLEHQLYENQAAQQAELEAEALSRIKLPANTKQTEVLVRHIRDSVKKDPVISTQRAAHLDLRPRPKRTS